MPQLASPRLSRPESHIQRKQTGYAQQPTPQCANPFAAKPVRGFNARYGG
jgi:hypothetical protein